MLVVLVAAVAGCSNSDNVRDAGSSALVDGVKRGEMDTADRTDGVVELEFFQFMPNTPAFDKVIDKFHEKYPHIRIKQNYVSNAANVLNVRMVSGDAPDLFNIGANDAYRSYAKKQLIVDLSNEAFMTRVSPAALEIIDFEGKKYGMPGTFNTMGIYYNKQIFNDLGIAVPQTRDELMAAADKIKAAGTNPFVFPDQDMPMINPLDFQTYTGVYNEIPKKIFWDAMDQKANLTDNEALRKSMQLYLDLRKYSGNSAEISMLDGFHQFAVGKAAMIPYVSFAAGVIKGMNPELDFSIFPLPGDDPAHIRVPIGIGFQFAISTQSKHIEEAKLFLDFWSQPDTAAFFETMDLVPSAINDVPSTTKETQLLRDYIAQGKTFQWPGEKYWSGKQTNDFAAYSKILVQTKNVNRVLTAMDSLFYGAGS
jgi:raffinose/stachyose/melibiose transport system substrate-binding protein